MRPSLSFRRVWRRRFQSRRVDQTVNGGVVIPLAATAADEDGTIATLLWTADGGSFNDTAIEDPIWTAPPGQDVDTEYTLRLTATDDDGRQSYAEVTITVRASTDEAILLDNAIQVIGTRVTIRNTLESAPIPAEWLPGGAEAYLVRVRVELNAGVEAVEIRLAQRQSDSGSEAGPHLLAAILSELRLLLTAGADTLKISGWDADTSDPYSIVPPNQAEVETWRESRANGEEVTARFYRTHPPTVSIQTPAQSVSGETEIALAATAADEDGNIVTYLWTADGGSFDDDSVEDPTWIAPASGLRSDQVFTLRLTVTDDDGRTAYAEVEITVPTALPYLSSTALIRTGLRRREFSSAGRTE